jgi:plasmid maintenance system antidote protein VapI
MRSAGYCDEAIAAILDLPLAHVNDFAKGKFRLTKELSNRVEAGTGRSPIMWAQLLTAERRS